MGLEANFYHQLNSSGNSNRGSNMSFESQMAEIQNQKRIVSSQLEEVEKQLQYFVKSPCGINTLSEAELWEKILEESLARTRERRQVLEAIKGNQPISEILPHSQAPSSGIMETSMLNWPPQNITPQIPTMSFNDLNQVEPMRNQYLQPSAEMLPPPQMIFERFGYPAAHAMNYPEHEVNLYMDQYDQDYGQFVHANLPLDRNNNNQWQGRTTTMIEQIQEDDDTIYGSMW
ncbi:hypothetical protein CFOL_v3_02312 [Cephalotus follicularis]|uniref:Uncharacterized protein n=1 Tax=Cephalotus follicularis TaxID=3775 RepID=A0A1Q3ASU1_CEPFO|nr:hypothetical protein CFOL_v3_02312 [Cephalotus follicularis]